jgi:hypothetical protein
MTKVQVSFHRLAKNCFNQVIDRFDPMDDVVGVVGADVLDAAVNGPGSADPLVLPQGPEEGEGVGGEILIEGDSLTLMPGFVDL